MNEFEKEIISIITNAGDCRAHCYKALDYADEGEYEEAEKEMELANDALGKAHVEQTQFLVKEARGEDIKCSILFVHAQDHLMTAISEKNLIERIVELRKVVNSLLASRSMEEVKEI